MNPREAGFLLLTSTLGNPERRPLTAAQFRVLAQRVADAPRLDPEKELDREDLTALGYGGDMAQRIFRLLQDEDVLEHYLRRGQRAGCSVLSRVSHGYPVLVRKQLGLEAPGCLWAKGNLSLLEQPAVALVGSRDIAPENMEFAKELGRQAALQGYVLVSGNARGADRTAQDSCLAAGGSVISVVADELERHRPRENMLYLSEDGFDLPFTGMRALSRNRVIHCLGGKTFVAQCGYQRGGTWDGTVKNLRFRWSPVFCFSDGSAAVEQLIDMGATGCSLSVLYNISAIKSDDFGLFDQ